MVLHPVVLSFLSLTLMQLLYVFWNTECYDDIRFADLHIMPQRVLVLTFLMVFWKGVLAPIRGHRKCYRIASASLLPWHSPGVLKSQASWAHWEAVCRAVLSDRRGV